MRKIDAIVIHCSATMESKPFNAKAIDAMHRARGFAKIGYHFVILLDGAVEKGRPVEEIGAHVAGHNSSTIGICYIGGIGLNARGKAVGKDTRTPAQVASMITLIKALHARFPGAKVKGHRDYSPDLNKDGKITSDEFIKECPCFDAQKWFASLPKLEACAA